MLLGGQTKGPKVSQQLWPLELPIEFITIIVITIPNTITFALTFANKAHRA